MFGFCNLRYSILFLISTRTELSDSRMRRSMSCYFHSLHHCTLVNFTGVVFARLVHSTAEFVKRSFGKCDEIRPSAIAFSGQTLWLAF